MRVLLDTHVFLWWILDDSRLTPTARNVIRDAGNVYWSAASSLTLVSEDDRLRLYDVVVVS